MTFDTLKYLSDIIDNRRTWVRCKADSGLMEFRILQGGFLKLIYSCSLTLESYHLRYTYPIGQQWKISMYEIEQAVRKLMITNPKIPYRLEHHQLTNKNVESIILEATHGIVHLDLDDYGLFDE